jgi:signal peptidase I
VLRAFCFQTFYIPSTSMVPTLQVGDRIVVSKLSVRFGTIHRGDILVFTRPPSEACGGAEVNDLVKRVIGLPGEGLKSVGNSIYYTEDPMTTSARGPTWHLMEQPWTHTEPLGAPITPDTVVPQGQYFMMGDNQSLSCDSRYWGPIERDSIVGKVFFRIWPLSRIGFL